MKAFLGQVEIPARDPAKLGRFLGAVFGWRIEEVAWEGAPYFRLRGPAGEDGATAALGGGLLDAAGACFRHPLPVVHLEDESLDDCLDRVEAAGGEIVERPRPIGEMVYCVDARQRIEGRIVKR